MFFSFLQLYFPGKSLDHDMKSANYLMTFQHPFMDYVTDVMTNSYPIDDSDNVEHYMILPNVFVLGLELMLPDVLAPMQAFCIVLRFGTYVSLLYCFV